MGPYTPECAESMTLARKAIEASQILLKEVANIMEQCSKLQKDAHQGVNDGIIKKASESIAMKVGSYSIPYMEKGAEELCTESQFPW